MTSRTFAPCSLPACIPYGVCGVCGLHSNRPPHLMHRHDALNKGCVTSENPSQVYLKSNRASRKSTAKLFLHLVASLDHYILFTPLSLTLPVCLSRSSPVTSPTGRRAAISRIIKLHQLLTMRRIIGF